MAFFGGIAVVWALLSATANAATINVPAEQPTIQAGIDAAVSGVDEVVVAPGTYNEIIDLLGKAITVRSSGGAAVTIIDASPVPAPGTGKPVIRCDKAEGPDTVIDGFTITGGMGDTALSPSYAQGGGMFNNDTSPAVTNCTFSGNTADFGGGMFNYYSNPTVTGCTFTANDTTLAGYGGGMFNDGADPTVTNCVFSGNTAIGEGELIIGYGGGMANLNSSDPDVTDCTFSGNWAACGGGMYNDFGVRSAVTNCTFSGNWAGWGGGMYNDTAGNPTVTNCTFSGNWAGWGGGMYNDPFYGGAMVINCIFWANADDDGGGDESAQIHDEPQDWRTNVVVNYSDIQGGWTRAGSNNINVDPLLTPDGHLRTGSPCIDVGTATGAPVDDRDGDARPQGAGVDMGSDEFVDTDMDGLPDWWETLYPTATG